MSELAFLGAVQAAARIRAGDLNPIALARACLEQVERHERRLNCFITLRADAALAEAAQPRPGPLSGVPVAVKDNVSTAGVRSTAGAKVLSDNVPTSDAPAWARLHDAGAILLGKTNMHELGMGPTSLNYHFGHTHNPWDVSRVPGGSSGGSAAAVAVGMAPVALGTDAGGSVRIPAALCGVVGLKGTHGRVPTRGGIAFANPTVDHIGPITRSVADAALVLQLMCGHDPDDPTCCGAPVGDFLGAAERGAREQDLRGLRVGVPMTWYWDDCHPGVESAVREAIAQLERLGATVRDVDIPDHKVLMDVLPSLGAEAAVHFGPLMRARLHDFSEQVQVRLLAGQFVLGSDYAAALRARRVLRQRYDAVFAEVDLLAAPTVPLPAPTIADVEADKEDFPLSRNTRPANQIGFPAISLPCGLADNLPIGLMLLARPFEEETLLRAAAAYERTRPWQRPPTN